MISTRQWRRRRRKVMIKPSSLPHVCSVVKNIQKMITAADFSGSICKFIELLLELVGIKICRFLAPSVTWFGTTELKSF